MRNLLRADLRRMLRWRGFHGAVIAMALLPFVNFFLYSAFGSGFSLQERLFNGVAAIGAYPVYGLVLAILLSLFPGTEFHDGTIHNKLIAGHRRGTVYLSQAITAAAAAVLLQLVYLVVTAAVFLPLVGHGKMTEGFTLDGGTLALLVLEGLLAGVAYAGIYTMVTMLLANQAAAAVVCLVVLVAGAIVSFNIPRMLDEEEFISGRVRVTTADGVTTEYYDSYPNPMYIPMPEGLRTFLSLSVRALPTTQCGEITMWGYSLAQYREYRDDDAKEAKYEEIAVFLEGANRYMPLFPLLSLGTTAVCTGVGLAVFRRKDLQ